MRSHYKKYLKKIYIVPIAFIATSFIFTTFAWFAYSGLRSVSTEIDVKTWHIELTKSNETINNNIVKIRKKENSVNISFNNEFYEKFKLI